MVNIQYDLSEQNARGILIYEKCDINDIFGFEEPANELAPYFVIIFQKCLDTGRVPKDWGSANVTAIFKKGEKYRPSTYRPVSLSCICCKIQEHILTSNTVKHLDEHHILTDCQRGFRARRSCETQLFTLAEELVSGLEKRDNSMTSSCWTSPRPRAP